MTARRDRELRPRKVIRRGKGPGSGMGLWLRGSGPRRCHHMGPRGRMGTHRHSSNWRPRRCGASRRKRRSRGNLRWSRCAILCRRDRGRPKGSRAWPRSSVDSVLRYGWSLRRPVERGSGDRRRRGAGPDADAVLRRPWPRSPCQGRRLGRPGRAQRSHQGPRRSHWPRRTESPRRLTLGGSLWHCSSSRRSQIGLRPH